MRRYYTHLIRQLVVQSKLTHSASSMIQLSRFIARRDQMPDLFPIKLFAAPCHRHTNWPSLFDPSPAFRRCGLPFVHNKSHTRNNVFPLAQSDSWKCFLAFVNFHATISPQCLCKAGCGTTVCVVTGANEHLSNEKP